jgi:hypothetical protein
MRKLGAKDRVAPGTAHFERFEACPWSRLINRTREVIEARRRVTW